MKGLILVLFMLPANTLTENVENGDQSYELKNIRRNHRLDGLLAASGFLQETITSGNLIVRCAARCDVIYNCTSYFVETRSSQCQLHGVVLDDVTGMKELETSFYFRMATECPPGWHLFMKSCYLIKVNNFMNFQDAKIFCTNKGAGLPIVDNEAENDFLKSLGQYVPSNSTGIFLGLIDSQQNGTWVWDETRETPSFTDWDDGQPQLDAQHCGFMLKPGFRWHDGPCSLTLTVVCEM